MYEYCMFIKIHHHDIKFNFIYIYKEMDLKIKGKKNQLPISLNFILSTTSSMSFMRSLYIWERKNEKKKLLAFIF